MNINIISRGKGKSAVAAAAYRAGETIKNEYDGQIHDYSKKKGIVHTEMFLPEYAPDEMADRATLWNAVEKIEKAKNAQLAREVRLALPNVFSLEQNIDLVHEYVRDNFVYHGMVADICIHDKGDGNPHAHVMLTMRPFEKDGTWGAKSKMEYILDDNGERIKLPSGRYKTKKISTTGWDEQSNAEIWRKSWADILNRYYEKDGYEIRVDHRSYARQGKEQLPTIHLGSVAHGLEQRGIATERGNINRQVKAANARLKTIDNEIHETQIQKSELLNPPKPQMIIDLENSIKAKDSPGYAHWCRLFNLQQMSRTLIYIQENGFTDMESLQSAHQNAKVNLADIQKQINSTKAEIKSLTVLKGQSEIYRNTLDVYKKYTAPGQLPFIKNNFCNRHKVDIEAHKKARAYIYEELKLEKFPSLKKLSGDIGGLREKEKLLRQDLKATQDNAKVLNNTVHNACMLLGYRELETKGYTPTIPQSGMRFIKPYEYSLAQAQKRGETEVYFQSLYMDIDCADFIRQRLEQGRAESSTVSAALTTYSKQRVEKVVAAFINNAPGKYPNHAEWASEKASAVDTTQMHQAYKYAPSDLFVQKFKEAADSMQSIIFKYDEHGSPLVDENGKATTKWGWAFPMEAAAQKQFAGDKNWDIGLSISEKMAMAKQKADEHNRNQPQRTAPKPKRSNNHER